LNNFNFFCFQINLCVLLINVFLQFNYRAINVINYLESNRNYIFLFVKTFMYLVKNYNRIEGFEYCKHMAQY